jgi:signal transduction histidine kinase
VQHGPVRSPSKHPILTVVSDVDVVVVPVLAMLSSGTAAVALDPRNGASRLLLAAGGCGAVSFLLGPLAAQQSDPSAGASLLRMGCTLTFLVFVSCFSGLLLVFPSGRAPLVWLGQALSGLMSVAVIAPLLQLVGSPTLVANGDESTRIANVWAVPGLRILGSVGDVLVGSEPLWGVAALAVLAWRYRRADGEARAVLRPLLASFVGLALLLLLVVAAGVGGFEWPQPWFQDVFVTALSAVPLVLLVGLSQRSRTLHRELLASRARLLTAEDHARRDLERDLHDGIQQRLVATLSLTELAARQARHRPDNVNATLGDVRTQLTETIEELREVVNGFRPPVLADAGVAAALETRLRRLPAEVTLEVSVLPHRRWSPETEAAAYFVACEAVTNALKHAPGAPVRVRITDSHGDLEIEVVDEGPGLPLQPTTGSGLTGLRDRVDSRGGAFTAARGPSGGTVIRAVFAS